MFRDWTEATLFWAGTDQIRFQHYLYPVPVLEHEPHIVRRQATTLGSSVQQPQPSASEVLHRPARGGPAELNPALKLPWPT